MSCKKSTRSWGETEAVREDVGGEEANLAQHKLVAETPAPFTAPAAGSQLQGTLKSPLETLREHRYFLHMEAQAGHVSGPPQV